MANVFSRGWTKYKETMMGLVGFISRSLGRYSLVVSKRPSLVFAISILATILCGLGWLRLHTESQGDKLWVPQHSSSMGNRDYVQKTFGSSDQNAAFLIQDTTGSAKITNGNALTPQVVWEAFKLHEKVLAVKSEDSGRNWLYTDVCFKNAGGECRQEGLLRFWDSNFTKYLADVGGSASDPTAGSTAALLATISRPFYPDGGQVKVSSVLGNIKRNASGAIIGAQVGTVGYGVDKKLALGTVNAWFDAYQDLMEAETKKLKYSVVYYETANSFNEEISRSISGDIYLVAIAVVIIIICAITVLARTLHPVNTRAMLAVYGAINIFLGLFAGYGLAALCGVPFTSLDQVLPFILLGIGLDHIYIFVRGMDDIDKIAPGLTMERRFQRLMETSGLSVLATGLTSVFAFALGANSRLPSIQWFCIYAAFAIAAELVLFMTFFLSCFVFTERRIAANRRDLCCCMTGPARAPPVNSNKVEVSPYSVPQTAVATREDSVSDAKNPTGWRRWLVQPKDIFEILVNEYYTPFLMITPVKVILLALITGAFLFGCWAFPNLTEGQQLQQICPDDSYVIPYEDLNDATYVKVVGTTAGLYFRNVDQSNPTNQDLFYKAWNTTIHDSYFSITESPSVNWLSELISFAKLSQPGLVLAPGCVNPFQPNVSGCIPQASFYALLPQFFKVPQYAFWRDSVLVNSSGQITDSFFYVTHRSKGDQDDYGRQSINAVHYLESHINDDIFAAANKTGEKPISFLYNGNYIYWEGDAMLRYNVLLNMGMAVLGVTIVQLVMLVHPLAAILMAVAVIVVDFLLYAEMKVLGIRFNDVSVINEIMAVGLAVDYSVHFAHRFLSIGGGTRNERVMAALRDSGSIILLAGVSTLLGLIPLAFASSDIFRTYFALLFGTVVFGQLVGLMMMPIIFSWIGPGKCIDDGSESHLPETNIMPQGKDEKSSASGNGAEHRNGGQVMVFDVDTPSTADPSRD